MKKDKIHVYLYNAFIVLCLLGGAVYVVSQFMHFGSGEFTDNARVRQNIVPQSSRIQGFIREVRFADFQEVNKGDTLVIIEDAEFRLRLAQAETDLIRAEHGAQGTASSIVTTKTSMIVTEAASSQHVYRWRMPCVRINVSRISSGRMLSRDNSMTGCILPI